MGVAITFFLWWVYFDDFKGEVVSATHKISFAWIYIHLPIHLLHLLFSVVITDVMRVYPEQPGYNLIQHFLIVGGSLFIFNALMKMLNSVANGGLKDKYNMAIYSSRLINGLIIFAMLFKKDYSAYLLMAIMTIFCFIQVVVDIAAIGFQARWLKKRSSDLNLSAQADIVLRQMAPLPSSSRNSAYESIRDGRPESLRPESSGPRPRNFADSERSF